MSFAENVIVKPNAWKESDIELLFADDEKVFFTEAETLQQLMKEMERNGYFSINIRSNSGRT